jgi:hypothetical protein
MISGTYLQLQRQIADELGARFGMLDPTDGSGLTLSPIQAAIQSAIAKWEREPFYFNEMYDVDKFSTVVDQEFYTTTDVPSFVNLTYIPQARILIDNQRYTLIKRGWQYLEDISTNPSAQSSIPTDFAYFGQQMRLYPIPNTVVPVTLMANERLTPLEEDADSNAWTTEGYDLIRSEAKLILAQEILFDDDLAARMSRAIYGNTNPMVGPIQKGYLTALREETSRRGEGGKIKPTQF